MNECGCMRTIKSTSVAVVGATLQITIPVVPLENGEEFNLIICQNIPASSGTSVVQIIQQPGGTPVSLFKVCGNFVRADQLRSRRCYKLIYGTDPIHYQMVCKIPRSGFCI